MSRHSEDMSSEFQEEEEDPPEIKYIDSVEFQNLSIPNDDAEIVFRWIDSFETEVVISISRCGQCKSLVPEYKKAAKLLKGIASVGSIDATTQQTIPSKYAIKGYPTIKIFGATDKNKAIDYNGPRTVKVIADAVWKSIEKEDKLKPEWKKAAKEMAGRVKFGALDARAHETIARKFQIQGFPTIKFFPPRSKSSDFEDYQGGRTSSDLIRYSESTYEDVIDETCRNRQLCIFTFLPSIFDCQSECRRAKIQILNDLAAIFKKRAFGWIWIEAGAQMEPEKVRKSINRYIFESGMCPGGVERLAFSAEI
ncbi:hypothetical protein CRE_25678 [Caenorhabditis remanei]|uniref:Thioredoxin domain-containing protein n=1 Tax=Caenorhabditis remanei TaxID=31234 RepID=E3MLF1_CAERE|nr:hypothetical protein CRE_25678 [Caenorhabditis remanei]